MTNHLPATSGVTNPTDLHHHISTQTSEEPPNDKTGRKAGADTSSAAMSTPTNEPRLVDQRQHSWCDWVTHGHSPLHYMVLSKQWGARFAPRLPFPWFFWSSQGCTAVSIDTCTALARFIGYFWRQTPMLVGLPLGFCKPTTRTNKNPRLWTQVWVLTGTGVGYSGKPQGSPWHSLVERGVAGIHSVLVGGWHLGPHPSREGRGSRSGGCEWSEGCWGGEGAWWWWKNEDKPTPPTVMWLMSIKTPLAPSKIAFNIHAK